MSSVYSEIKYTFVVWMNEPVANYNMDIILHIFANYISSSF